jgi:outer membrane protein assembly factor BamB
MITELTSEQQLQLAEDIALGSAALVTILTYIFVGHGSGVEANPIADWLITTIGWHGFAAVRLSAVGLAFTAAHELYSRDGSRITLAFVWLWSAAMTANLIHDLSWATYGGLPAGVPTGATLAFVALSGVFVTAWSSRSFSPTQIRTLPRPNGRQLRAVALVALLVVSIIPAGTVADFTQTDQPSINNSPIEDAEGPDKSLSAASTTVTTAGNEEWNYSTGANIGSGPTIAHGNVYGGTNNGNVFAVNSSTGNEVFNRSVASSYIFTSVAVGNGTVFAGSWDNNLYALNATNGSQKWSFQTGNNIDSSPAYRNGVIYVGSDDNNLYAVHENGTEKWNYSAGASVTQGITVHGGIVYIGDNSGVVHAVHTNNGTKKWNYGGAGSSIDGSPTVANGSVIYAENTGGVLYSVDKETGTEEWTNSLGGSNNIQSSPTYHNGSIYIGDNKGNVYSVDESGTVQWTYSDFTEIDSGPTVAGNTIYVGDKSSPHNFAALETSGNLKWNFTTPSNSITSDPTVADGTVYFGSNDQNLYAVGTDHTQSSNGTRVTQGTHGHIDDLSKLGGSGGQTVSGRVVDQHGEPVPENTTVEVWGVSESHFDTSDADELERRGQEFLEEADDPLPDSFNPNAGFDMNGEYLLVHEAEDWDRDGYAQLPTDSQIDAPTLQPSADQRVVLSLWDASDGQGYFSNPVAESFPGTPQEQDIVIEQLTPTDEVRQSQTYESEVIATTNTGVSDNEHYGVITALPRGVYQAYPEGDNSTIVVFTVGDSQELAGQIETQLRDRGNNLVDRSDRIRELIGNDTMIRKHTRTGENGSFNVSVPSNVVTVQVNAYRADGEALQDAENASLQYLRNVSEAGYNGTFILPSPNPTRVSPPADNVTVETIRSPHIPNRNMTDFANLMDFLNDYFGNRTDMFAGAPVNVDDWQSFVELRNRYIGMVGNNSNATAYLDEEYPEYTENGSAGPTLTLEQVNSSDLDNLSRTDVQTYVTQTYALADALQHTPISLDPESVEQSVDNRVAEYTDTITTGRTIDSLDELTVEAVYADGTTETIPNDRLELQTLQSGSSTQVAISNYQTQADTELSAVSITFDSAASGTVNATVQDSSQTLTERIDVAMDIAKSDTDVIVNFENGTSRSLADGNWTLANTDGHGATIFIDNWQVPAGKTAVSPVEVRPGTYTEVGSSVDNTSYLDATVEFGDGSTVGGPSFSADEVIVLAKYQGTQEEIPQDYWSINDQLTSGSQIEIQDYPIAADVANVDIQVIAASEAGIGRTTLSVDNPSFAGQDPGIQSIPISTLSPGPSERVTFDVTPAERSTFGNITSAEVRAPNESQIPVTVSEGEVSFQTVGEGAHTVSVRYQADDGSRFSESFDVLATPEPYEAPATMKVRASPNGLYVLAGDSLDNGRARLTEGTTVEVATQIGVDADVPGEVHAHLEDVEEATRGQTMLRVVRGDDEQGIRDHVTYIVHTEGIPEEAYIYQGDTPIPESGSPNGEVRHNGSYTVITLVSGPDASASYTVVRNPTFRDKITWEVRMVMTKINVPVLFASPTGLGTGGTVLGVLFVFGYRRRGRGGRPLAGRVPDPLEASG